jgi:hypothetical protein
MFPFNFNSAPTRSSNETPRVIRIIFKPVKIGSSDGESVRDGPSQTHFRPGFVRASSLFYRSAAATAIINFRMMLSSNCAALGGS